MSFRSLFVAASFAVLAAPAFAGNTFTFETAQPVAEKRVSADGTVWSCDGSVCRGELDRKAPSVSSCKKIAKKAGEVTSYSSKNGTLSPEQIAACNSGVKKVASK
jgi:hypothetical protein